MSCSITHGHVYVNNIILTMLFLLPTDDESLGEQTAGRTSTARKHACAPVRRQRRVRVYSNRSRHGLALVLHSTSGSRVQEQLGGLGRHLPVQAKGCLTC